MPRSRPCTCKARRCGPRCPRDRSTPGRSCWSLLRGGAGCAALGTRAAGAGRCGGHVHPPAGLATVKVTPVQVPKKPHVVEDVKGYNSWPMLQAIGDKLVCVYTRGAGHTIGEDARATYARTSTDGARPGRRKQRWPILQGTAMCPWGKDWMPTARCSSGCVAWGKSASTTCTAARME